MAGCVNLIPLVVPIGYWPANKPLYPPPLLPPPNTPYTIYYCYSKVWCHFA